MKLANESAHCIQGLWFKCYTKAVMALCFVSLLRCDWWLFRTYHECVNKATLTGCWSVFLGTWGGNLEDLTSEDWNEDVRQHLFNNLKGICNASVWGLTQFVYWYCFKFALACLVLLATDVNSLSTGKESVILCGVTINLAPNDCWYTV